jgi:integrase/recombinase XerD
MNRLHRFDVLAEWYREHLTITGYRPRTIADYCFELSFFRRFVEKHTKLSDIDELNAKTLRFYIAQLYDRNLSPGTIHHKCSALINFLGAIYQENKYYTDLRPHISLPRTGRKLPATILTEKEMQRVFDYLEELTGSLTVREHTEAVPVRDHAMLELMYSTGVRLSEIIHLDLCDIDYDTGLVQVRQGKGGKDRVVPIGATSLMVLRRYVHDARPVIAADANALFVTRFGRRVGTEAVRNAITRVMKGAGIERHVTPHAIRHTCATHLLNNGADIRYVQELLGHASLSSTQVYTHVSIDRLKQTHAKYHPRERDDGDGTD